LLHLGRVGVAVARLVVVGVIGVIGERFGQQFLVEIARQVFQLPRLKKKFQKNLQKIFFGFLVRTRVARSFLVHDIKTGKMYQMNTKYPKCQ
jgi:hypothetical protein